MSSEDKWALLDGKLDGILRNQSYITQKVLLIQRQLEQLTTPTPAKGNAPKPKVEFQPVTEEEVIPPVNKNTEIPKEEKVEILKEGKVEGCSSRRKSSSRKGSPRRKTYSKGSYRGTYYPS